MRLFQTLKYFGKSQSVVRSLSLFGLAGLVFKAYTKFQSPYEVHTSDLVPQNDYRVISSKDLQAYMSTPQYYANTIFVFKKQFLSQIAYLLQDRRTKIVLVNIDDGPIFDQYDAVGINTRGDSQLMRFSFTHNLTQMQNFFDGVLELENLPQLFSLVQNEDYKVILTFLPEIKNRANLISPSWVEKVEELDKYKISNEKDLQNIEKKFHQLKYVNIDNFTQHVIIRSLDHAQELGLSDGDYGSIYVFKRATPFQRDSSFIKNGIEYNLCKVEPDPNLEQFDEFMEKEKNDFNPASKHLLEALFDQKIVLPDFISANIFDCAKILPRLTLRTLPYVSNVVNDQQLRNILQTGQQMGIKYILICSTENEHILNKLISFKRGLNTLQQQQLLVINSPNQELFKRFLQIEVVPENPRLIILNEKNDYKADLKIEQPQNSQDIIDSLDHFSNITYTSKRYRYFGKITINKLRYLLQEVIPQFGVKTSKTFEDLSLFEKFQEFSKYTQVQNIKDQTPVKTLVSNELICEDDQLEVIYFYKHNCSQCSVMNSRFDQASIILNQIKSYVSENESFKRQSNPYDFNIVNKHRIMNPQNFINLRCVKYIINSTVRYNILNEQPIIPSPTVTPMIMLKKGDKFTQIDFQKWRINPQDTEKIIQLVVKSIDQLKN